MNSCDFVGTLGKDWEVKVNQAGKQRASNSLAIRKYNGETLWINLIIFNEKRIPTLTQYTKKGDKFGVETHLDINDYEKDGQNKQYVSFVIDNFTLCGSRPQQDNSGYQSHNNQPMERQNNNGGYGDYQPPTDDDIGF